MSNTKFEPRTYRVVLPKGNLESTVTFEGFDRCYSTRRLERVALILEDGGVDVYALDVETTGHDFLDFLRINHPEAMFLGFYTREQLR